MPIGHEQVEPSVVVIVQKSCAPSQKWDRHIGDAGCKTYIREAGVTIIAVECVVIVGEVSDAKVHFPVVVVVADCDSHCRLLAAFVVESES